MLFTFIQQLQLETLIRVATNINLFVWRSTQTRIEGLGPQYTIYVIGWEVVENPSSI